MSASLPDNLYGYNPEGRNSCVTGVTEKGSGWLICGQNIEKTYFRAKGWTSTTVICGEEYLYIRYMCCCTRRSFASEGNPLLMAQRVFYFELTAVNARRWSVNAPGLGLQIATP